jgi:hypothetical protein
MYLLLHLRCIRCGNKLNLVFTHLSPFHHAHHLFLHARHTSSRRSSHANGAEAAGKAQAAQKDHGLASQNELDVPVVPGLKLALLLCYFVGADVES